MTKLSDTKNTLQNLSKEIDRQREALNNDYDFLSTHLRDVLKQGLLDKERKIHLEWYTVSVHTEYVLLSKRLKDLQKELNDASKTIQD